MVSQLYDFIIVYHMQTLHTCCKVRWACFGSPNYSCACIVLPSSLLPSLQWPTFFSDLLQCAGSGTKTSVDLYLRVLLTIDEEVVDRQIVHTQEVSYSAVHFHPCSCIHVWWRDLHEHVAEVVLCTCFLVLF